jgi:hypothetical protein
MGCHTGSPEDRHAEENAMKFRRLSDRVVVRRVKEEEKTTGGIIQKQAPGMGSGEHGATAHGLLERQTAGPRKR